MNYVCLSPNFPPNYVNFSKRLHERGVTVLGIGSDPYDHLAPVLKDALTEYYRVDDMEHYDSVLRACAYFTFKYGKLDRIESHNEHWLAQDARLRTD
ncbi:MAG: carboxylate--amine ligase, partial [Bacillota bacterium]|nr:carboxylate--amine ligase [Bacillota bacterium]